jgi:hypothetical protein
VVCNTARDTEVRRNERSPGTRGHAVVAAEGKFSTGHTENWLAGESMTRYWRHPCFFGFHSPATVIGIRPTCCR